jgi:hypothetical protein
MRTTLCAALALALPSVLPPAGPAPARAGEAPGTPVNYTASDRFNVRCQVKDTGGAGASTVEVWASADGGRTWKKYGEDPTLSGKALIKVPADGTYDFVTVAVDKAGNREKPPDEKTVPAFRVVVDRAAPRVTAKGPVEGTLGQAGAVAEFTWKAEDPHLSGMAGPSSGLPPATAPATRAPPRPAR